jgi:hypothetical protein
MVSHPRIQIPNLSGAPIVKVGLHSCMNSLN